MKFVKTLSGFVTGAHKIDLSNFTIPTAERMAPWFVSLLSGFVLASAVGLVAAHALMPKVTAFSEAQASGQDPSVFVSNRPTEGEFKTILARNIFNSEGGAAVEKEGGCEEKKSELPLKFTGVIFGGKADSSIVVLESTTTKQADTFLLGEAVPGDAKIADIQRDKVFFERNNCREFLDLEQPELPKKRIAGEKKRLAKPAGGDVAEGNQFREDGFERAGTAVAATRQWVEKALTVDFAKTLQDAKASPNTVNGEVKGFVLTRIRPDSVYEKMGLQDGDVVCAINGIELNDAARAIQTLNAMRNERKIELCVMRGGSRMNYDVQVK